MAWSGLIRRWDASRGISRNLILRIEDTEEPGCLVRLYDEEAMVGEELAETPQQAVAKAVQLAQHYLNDPSVTEQSLDWIQVLNGRPAATRK